MQFRTIPKKRRTRAQIQAEEDFLEGRTPGLTGKLNNDSYTYRNLCLGFDQSYSGTGIALAGELRNGDYEIIHCESVRPVPGESKSDYRVKVRKAINRIIVKYRHLGDELFAVCEAVRFNTQGAQVVNYHLIWGALMGTICDYLWECQEVTLRKADTRAWKKAVIGTSKPADSAPKGVDPKKWPTIQHMLYVEDVPKECLRIERPPRSRVYTWEEDGKKYTYDDNVADACGIALYGLITPLNKLKLAP